MKSSVELIRDILLDDREWAVIISKSFVEPLLSAVRSTQTVRAGGSTKVKPLEDAGRFSYLERKRISLRQPSKRRSTLTEPKLKMDR